MAGCKYYSFYALAKINDPELLYEAFQQQIAAGHADKVKVTVYERADGHWQQLTRSAGREQKIPAPILAILDKKIGLEDSESWCFEADLDAWFCSYKPLTTKHFILLIKSPSPEILIEDEYLQFLFHFYCHQLQMLQGTYRDALTGLYNRRAFNERIPQLLESSTSHQRRAINFSPSIYVMIDIDHFKLVNDSMGHLLGDEVLLLLAQLMTDSFRENDLLFRYGGEEFAMVLMDITRQQAMLSLDRFREKIANHVFPHAKQVTISIGYTHFDKKLSMDDLIGQADKALYYCKATTRNAVYGYQELVEKGLIPLLETRSSAGIEVT